MSIISLFRNTINRVLGPGKDLPGVSIGQKHDESWGIWTIYDGVLKISGSAVTVFHFEAGSAKELLPLAQNAFKRLRAVRHPGFLAFLDGAMTDSSVSIVTEPVTRLSIPVDSRMSMLGIQALAKALHFLHTECKLVHYNIGVHSVFQTRSGEWKLGGAELIGSLNIGMMRVLFDNLPVLPSDFSSGIDGFACDKFLFGYFVASVCKELNSVVAPLLDHRPQNRPDLALFYTAPFFRESPIVQISSMLDSFASMDERERVAFVDSIDVDLVPPAYVEFKLMPVLMDALLHGSVGCNAFALLLKTASKMQSFSFNSSFVPHLVKLWTSKDRSLRMALLASMEQYISRIDAQIVSDKIFPQFALGFNDAAAVLRERTVTCASVIAPHVSPKILHKDLLVLLGKSQTDQEPIVRCNTVIAIVFVSKILRLDERKRILPPALMRSLRDAVPIVRCAGLRALQASLEYFEFEQLAKQILPIICPILAENDDQQRQIAADILLTAVNLIKTSFVVENAHNIVENAHNIVENAHNIVENEQIVAKNANYLVENARIFENKHYVVENTQIFENAQIDVENTHVAKSWNDDMWDLEPFESLELPKQEPVLCNTPKKSEISFAGENPWE